MIIQAKDLKRGMVIYNAWSDYICTVEDTWNGDVDGTIIIAHDKSSQFGFMFRKKHRPIPVIGQSTEVK